MGEARDTRRGRLRTVISLTTPGDAGPDPLACEIRRHIAHARAPRVHRRHIAHARAVRVHRPDWRTLVCLASRRGWLLHCPVVVRWCSTRLSRPRRHSNVRCAAAHPRREASRHLGGVLRVAVPSPPRSGVWISGWSHMRGAPAHDAAPRLRAVVIRSDTIESAGAG